MPAFHEAVQGYGAKMVVMVALAYEGLFFFRFPLVVHPLKGSFHMAKRCGQDPSVGRVNLVLGKIGKFLQKRREKKASPQEFPAAFNRGLYRDCVGRRIAPFVPIETIGPQ